jgi:hypothetical protein
LELLCPIQYLVSTILEAVIARNLTAGKNTVNVFRLGSNVKHHANAKDAETLLIIAIMMITSIFMDPHLLNK